MTETVANASSWRSRRAAKTDISLPTVVGEAGWPCVRDSIATAACSRASPRTASIRSRIEGKSARARASESIIA